MSPDARQHLSDQQAELVRVLTKIDAGQIGFDQRRLDAASASLLRKRIRGVAKMWPRLAQSLGHEFRERFTRYAQTRSIPRAGGALEDGWHFALSLRNEMNLSDAAYVEMLAVKLRYKHSENGFVPRRHASVISGCIPQSKYIVFAVRWAKFGEKWIFLPLRFRSARRDEQNRPSEQSRALLSKNST